MTNSERIALLEAARVEQGMVLKQHSLLLEKIDKNVTSLLASRSYIRGAWKAIVVTATAVSGIVTFVLGWLKAH